MKVLFQRHILAVFVLAWLLCGLKAPAQGFGLAVTNPPAPVSVGGTLIYTFTVTNMGLGNLPQFAVTNTFSQNVNFLTFSNSYPTNTWIAQTNQNVLAYAFNVFTNNDVISFSYSVQPTTSGPLTNQILVATLTSTNIAFTNIVTQIYTGTADLGVTVTGPAQAVVTNDITSYSVIVTNLGPQAATGVFLTNTLPPGVTLKGVSPSSPGYSLSGSNMIFNLGTLASGAGGSFAITIMPTNVETVALAASIGSGTVLDTNTANNFASTNVSFIGYLPGVLVAFTNSAQTVNFQNGTEEQIIVVSNAGAVSIPGVRVVVTGLTNQLFNAVGTNGSSPFVYLSVSLAVGQSASAHLQYLPHNPFPFTNSQLNAFAIQPPVWTPPWQGSAISAVTNIDIRRIVEMPNGEMLLEFPTATNKTYTIVYSDNIQFSNAMMAVPSILSSANAIQWDDYGPPETVSFPTNSPMRFYRVFQNP